MKFVGLFGGEFKILEDVSPEKISDLESDFSWIDIDRLDPQTEVALKKKYGVKSINESGFPAITRYDGYDLVLVNYFENLSKKELQILISEKFIITLHQGADSVCDETMASLNEMLISGNFNSDMVFHGLMVTLVKRHADHLRALHASLRTMNNQLRQGLTELAYLFQLNRAANQLNRVFYANKFQLMDIVLGAIELKGLHDPGSLSYLYEKMNSLVKGAEGFSELTDIYVNSAVPFIWDQLNRTRRMATGVGMFAASLAASALFYIFAPPNLLEMDNMFIVAGIVALGSILALTMTMRKPKLRIL